jgi:hypothetical protein
MSKIHKLNKKNHMLTFLSKLTNNGIKSMSLDAKISEKFGSFKIKLDMLAILGNLFILFQPES